MMRTAKCSARAVIALAIAAAALGGCGGGGGENAPNTAPIADAGKDRATTAGRWTRLDGTGSRDPDSGNRLTYRWTVMSKPSTGKVLLLESTSANPIVLADTEGAYALALTVNDGRADSNLSVMHLSVAAGDVVPFLVPPFEGTAPLVSWADHDSRKGITVNFRGERVTTEDDHIGYDWGMPEGSKILAAADGTVIGIGDNFCPSPDLVVLLEHRPAGMRSDIRGYQTTYAHLARVDVVLGQTVTAGQQIGASAPGDRPSCHVFKPHLHFAVARITTTGRVDQVDPFGWMGSEAIPDDPLSSQNRAESVWLWRESPTLPASTSD